MKNNLSSFIGLMQKAGALSSGEVAVEIDIKKKKSKLVIIAEDASENTKKKFTDMAKYRNIKYVYFQTKEVLGMYLGKSERSVLSINNEGFAKSFLSKLEAK